MFRIIIMTVLFVSLSLMPPGFTKLVGRSIIKMESLYPTTISTSQLEIQPDYILVDGGPGTGHCC